MNFLKGVLFNQSKNVDVDGYEKIQNRINEKNNYLQSIYHCFNDLNKVLKDFSVKLNTLNLNLANIIYPSEEKTIHEACKYIYQKIVNNILTDKNLVEDITNNLSENISKFNEEKAFYDEFKRINNQLHDEREKLRKNKELYHKAGKEAENKIKKFVQNNNEQLSNLPEEKKQELEGITHNPKKALNNYKNSVNKVNQLVDIFNNKQSELFNYLPDLANHDGFFFFRFIKLYLQNLDMTEKYLNINKKKMSESKALEGNSKLKELIEENEINRRDEKKVDLLQYQTDLEFSKCKDKKEFDLFALTVDTINKYIDKDIFPNYNYVHESKCFNEGQLVKKLFEIKEDIDEKTSHEFLETLKDTSVHKYIYIVLSQLRTNNRFKRSKSLIELLGKTFNILLRNAQRKNLYENARNSIILSQTYFYLDEKNKKVYLFELIKKNNWLTNPKFWRGFIDTMIKQEFIRFQKIFPENNFDVEENINITKKIKDKLNEIVFSQLLTFITNMLDFEIDKRIVIKITDEFIEKFNYLSDKNKESVFGMISSDKEEIEKLRKEYNPSLEPELIEVKDDDDIMEETKEKASINKEKSEEISEKKEEIKEKQEDKEKTKEENLEKSDNKEDLKDKEEPKEESKEEKKDEEEKKDVEDKKEEKEKKDEEEKK